MCIDFSLCVLAQDSFSHFKIQSVCWKRSAIGSLSHSSGTKWISAPKSICFWSLLTGRKIGTVALSCFSCATSPLNLVLRQGRRMNSRGMIPGCAGQMTRAFVLHVGLRGMHRWNTVDSRGQLTSCGKRRTSADWLSSN